MKQGEIQPKNSLLKSNKAKFLEWFFFLANTLIKTDFIFNYIYFSGIFLSHCYSDYEAFKIKYKKFKISALKLILKSAGDPDKQLDQSQHYRNSELIH